VGAGLADALFRILDRVSSLGAAARAQTGNGEGNLEWRHGLSLFGELKYPSAFKHFDYVNPKAPKGGSVRLMAIGTFDNFNEVVSGLKGSIAAGGGLISDPLVAPALHEEVAEDRPTRAAR